MESKNINFLDNLASFNEIYDEKWNSDKGWLLKHMTHILFFIFFICLIFGYIKTNYYLSKNKNEKMSFTKIYMINVFKMFLTLMFIYFIIGVVQYYEVAKTESCINIQKNVNKLNEKDAFIYCRQKKEFEQLKNYNNRFR